MLEIEVKYYLGDEASARQVCHELNLPWTEGLFEVNRIFDHADGRLKNRGALVRIRERGDGGWLTYKEKTDQQVDLAKVRLEYDTAISDPHTARDILNKLELQEVFSYERRRARHTLGDAHVEIDCLPGGWFCEIEADPETIAKLVKQGGLADLQAIVWSYPEIFMRIMEQSGSAAVNWTFDGAARGEFAVPAPGDDFWRAAGREA